MIRVSTSGRIGRIALVALLLACFVGVQSVAEVHQHRDTDHSCAVCGVSHLAVGPAAAAIEFAAPAAVNWQQASAADRHPIELSRALPTSRGPPATFSL